MVSNLFKKSKLAIIGIYLLLSGCTDNPEKLDKFFCEFSFQGKTYSSLNVSCELDYLDFKSSEQLGDLSLDTGYKGVWALTIFFISPEINLYVNKTYYQSVGNKAIFTKSGRTTFFSAPIVLSSAPNIEVGEIKGSYICFRQ
jgi:hypothetical protein